MAFPSGHVTAAAAFFVLAVYLRQKAVGSRDANGIWWASAAVIVLLVGIARIVLKAHWPLDGAGGAALGLACASAAAWWNERHSLDRSARA